MADFLDQVFEEQPETAEPAPVEPEHVAEPAATPEPAPEPEKPAEPEPQPAKPDAGYVPIAAMMDERDKRKALEARVREFEQSQQRGEQPSIPDPFDDPQGYAAYNQRQLDERTMQVTFNISERFARQANGDEAVNEAISWATEKGKTDPIFAASYMREPDPIGYIVQQHKRDALLADIGDPTKLDDWFAREAAKRGYAMPSATDPVAAPVAAVTPSAARPPRSIASDTAAPASVTPASDKEGFLAAFK